MNERLFKNINKNQIIYILCYVINNYILNLSMKTSLLSILV